MKTRTLMLLALVCGVAIMLAGAVFLVQLSGQDDADPPVEIGARGTAGDMAVIVDEAIEQGGMLEVAVRIGGVADADGARSFRLIASGRAVSLPDPPAGGTCAATAVEVAPCLLRFDVSGAAGTSRVLFYDRGDTTLRWVLG